MKKRLYSVDIFRIVSAVFIFLFHSRIHLNVDFFVFNPFIGLGNVFMVAFFMLSGFSLYYVDWQNNQIDYDGGGYNRIDSFIRKRIIGIYPLYIATYVFYILVYVLGFSLVRNNEYINEYIIQNISNYSIVKNLLILPVELTMLQSVFDGSFSVLHNGGTWFISCLFICYLIYPLIVRVITQNKKRNKIMILLYFISSYSFLVQWGFKFGSIYGNPFFRFLEFLIGVIIASLCTDKINEDIKPTKLFQVFVLFFILVAVITVGVHWFRIYEVGAYNFIAIPVFGMILYLLARIEYKYPIKRFLKCISVLSENTYAFFLAQFFTWQPVKVIDNNTNFFNYGRNIKLFLFSLVICMSVTIFLHYGIEKPVKKILNRKYLLGR